MVCITILLQVSTHHIHLQDRGEVVKPSEEQRINVGSPMPLVGVLCPWFTSLWFRMGYTEEVPDNGVTSPVQSKNLSVRLQKNPTWMFL